MKIPLHMNSVNRSRASSEHFKRSRIGPEGRYKSFKRLTLFPSRSSAAGVRFFTVSRQGMAWNGTTLFFAGTDFLAIAAPNGENGPNSYTVRRPGTFIW